MHATRCSCQRPSKAARGAGCHTIPFILHPLNRRSLSAIASMTFRPALLLCAVLALAASAAATGGHRKPRQGDTCHLRRYACADKQFFCNGGVLQACPAGDNLCPALRDVGALPPDCVDRLTRVRTRAAVLPPQRRCCRRYRRYPPDHPPTPAPCPPCRHHLRDPVRQERPEGQPLRDPLLPPRAAGQQVAQAAAQAHSQAQHHPQLPPRG